MSKAAVNDAVATSEVVGSGGGGRLVVHVGPHKTGTSSTQYFLVQNAAWLNETYGIKVSNGKPVA